jgi:hypothetical protein
LGRRALLIFVLLVSGCFGSRNGLGAADAAGFDSGDRKLKEITPDDEEDEEATVSLRLPMEYQ